MVVRLPLPHQVASTLRSRIIDGIWGAGEQIPSEDELAKEFGVSRATIREAVSLLTVQGFLAKRRGVGTFVGQPKAISGGLETLISITEWIEGHGYQAGTSYRDITRRPPSRREQELFAAWKPSQVAEIHRVRTANDVPVLYCVDVLPGEFAPVEGQELDESLFGYLERQWGQVIIFARTEIEVAQTSASMAQHLDVSPKSSLLRLRQAHYNQNSTLLLWSQDHFVADRFRFQVIRHRQ